MRLLNKHDIKTIIFFIDGLRIGGKERRCIQLLKGLKNSEFDIHIVSIRNEIKFLEFFDLEYPLYTIEKKTKINLSIFYKFYLLCKEIKPDIVHSWSGINTFYALPARSSLKFKLLNAQITNANPRAENEFKWGFDSIKFYIRNKINFFLSDLNLSNSISGLRSYNLKNKCNKYIHNGLDLDRIKYLIKPNQIREKYNINTRYVICMVANFTIEKDYKTYIRAANIITSNRNDICFLIIGFGYSYEKYGELVNNNKHIIIIEGKEEITLSLVNIADICILLNKKKYGEGISNSIMEYMALGKPVIATRSGGTQELVKHGINGYLIGPENLNSLVQKIELLIKSIKTREEFGLNGKEIIEKKFNLENMSLKFRVLYTDLIKNRKI